MRVILGGILELSKRSLKGGRVPIKIALLKIHDDANETNRNGLHWKEEYVANAIDSVKFMPICATFCDETKSTPLDHGFTGEDIDSDGIHEPLFENSETVGCFESASIEKVTINGNEIKALVATGFIYSQRYPNLVKWIRKNHALAMVDTSVEIMGLEMNNNKIIYEESDPKQDYRTPKEFIFTASSLLSVLPADENAVVLEVAQRKETEEEKKLNEKELKDLIQSTISETNSRNEELNKKITELNSTIIEKDSIIAGKDEKISELNATVEQIQKALKDLEEEKEAYWAEREALQRELGELKAKARLGELNAAIEGFSDEEKKFAESEINSFNENPLEGNIDDIVSKIFVGIGRNYKKNEENNRTSEYNSSDDNLDIFAEINSAVDNDDDDTNIF